jgi:hypothetical protein
MLLCNTPNPKPTTPYASRSRFRVWMRQCCAAVRRVKPQCGVATRTTRRCGAGPLRFSGARRKFSGMPAANLGSSRYFNGICRLADFATVNSSAHCGLRRHAQFPARWCRGGGQVRDSLRQGVDASATPRAVSWARAKPASIRARAQTLAGGETKTVRPVVTLSPALPRWASV